MIRVCWWSVSPPNVYDCQILTKQRQFREVQGTIVCQAFTYLFKESCLSRGGDINSDCACSRRPLS